MSRWVALGLGLVSLAAAVVLFASGTLIPAAVALAFSFACDVMFFVVSRGATTDRKGS